MSRTDLWLGLPFLFVVACSSDGAPASSTEGGASAGGQEGGGMGGTAQVGGGGADTGGSGGGGETGNGPPAGGNGAIEEWLIDQCNDLLDEGCPQVAPVGDPAHPYGHYQCIGFPVEVLPDMFTCGPSGFTEDVCVPQFPAGQGGCSTLDCPAEPASHFYWFRERSTGEVELVHSAGDFCSWTNPPIGFTQCQMKPTDPEACLCRCEL